LLKQQKIVFAEISYQINYDLKYFLRFDALFALALIEQPFETGLKSTDMIHKEMIA
jgi:hypothetical protein